MGKIRWTEKASSHLQSIHEYIASDSQVYATRFIKSLIKATDRLKEMPYCGRIVPELESYGFREVIFKDYRIVYRVLDNSDDVEILAVLHSALEFETTFHKEWELQ